MCHIRTGTMARDCRRPCPLPVVDDCISSGADFANACSFSTAFTESQPPSPHTGATLFPNSKYNKDKRTTRKQNRSFVSPQIMNIAPRVVFPNRSKARIWGPFLSAQIGTVEFPTQV
ncbi:uncharacterized protein M421DRAFT_248465 [Didymella exigua CBS 183.55]|uniref:Uncharacterized protein n=1 Tax=Didymella exigua CBS 183.55 TaxID=1150837 RepID=A0A6A5S2P6_9PLEO|nr:uncharacterized protein M421DRAFT_248465 [Didymella exigua CBS 183.55]KAF1932746.1 hypothetical protein M421DRAFT_248465 [Didymella exigua CBS 183.55]